MGNYSSVKKKVDYWCRIKELFPYYPFAYVNEINFYCQTIPFLKEMIEFWLSFPK